MTARARAALPFSALFAVSFLAACGGAPAAPSDAAPSAPPAGIPTAAPGDATPAPEASAAPTPGTSLDACAIVTPADVAAATGVAGAEPGTLEQVPTPLSPARTECTYEGDFGRIIVELTPEDGANLYDAARRSYDDAVDLPAVGDGAFVSAANKRAFVREGAVAVMLTMFLNGADRIEVATSLGRAVVAKL